MLVYIDKDFRCHPDYAEGFRGFDVPFFEGKCRRFIEGYRYVPPGEMWQREDGAEFHGEMTAPAEDFTVLSAAQQLYERVMPELSELKAKLETLRDCLDGLAANPGLEQLMDFLHSVRELLEED